MKRAAALAMVLSAIANGAWAQAKPTPKYKAVVPQSITTPDKVQTRIGTLKFRDGLPDEETVKKVYDNLDFVRGVEVFLRGMPAASVQAMKQGFIAGGFPPNQGFGLSETLADARAPFLTANSVVVYCWAIVDVKDGPMVLRVPPGVLGILDDADFRFVTDLGLTGPDQGKGGKYLVVPPGYKGELPSKDYFVQKSPTFTNIIIMRAFIQGSDAATIVKRMKENTAMYPLAAAGKPPQQKFVNFSGMTFNTVHANNIEFYDELNEVVQHEPADFVEPETVGLYASIGIKKGQPYKPDARMKAILTDAVAVANATSRATVFASRDPLAKAWPDRQWTTTFTRKSHEFLHAGERTLDARTMFYYYATGMTPMMANPQLGKGAAYVYTARDGRGKYLDGSKAYKVTLPANVPAARFWSFNVYDNQTRSFLETDQKLAGLDSTLPDVKKNADGSVTVWFGPKAPTGQEGNWVQTWPGKGWNTILRLYGPTQGWFDQSWRPGELFSLIKHCDQT
jgi:hypothetical protein